MTSHRRRRHRRGTEDIEIEGGVDDDVETVTRVRAPRLADSHASNTVTGVRGSHPPGGEACAAASPAPVAATS